MSAIASSSSTSESIDSAESSTTETPLKVSGKVFIFDIEDITMLSDSQIEQNAQKFPEFSILSMSEKLEQLNSKLGFDGLIDKDVVGNGTLESKDSDAKLNLIRRKYESMTRSSNVISNFITDFEGSHVFSNRWNIIRNSLKLINRISEDSCDRKFEVIAICREGVAQGAIQLLMASLSSEIQFGNIYSTARRSDEEVLKTIMNRFGKNYGYGIITSKKEVIEVAQNLGMYSWQVETNQECDDFFNQIYGYEVPEKLVSLLTASTLLTNEEKPEIVPIEQRKQQAAQNGVQEAASQEYQIEIKQEVIEEVKQELVEEEQPAITQHVVPENEVKIEPIDGEQGQLPNRPLRVKPQRKVDRTPNHEALNRCYPIPEKYWKNPNHYFLKSQGRIDDEKEAKRKALERRLRLKLVRRAKAALLGKGVTTRRQARNVNAENEQVAERAKNPNGGMRKGAVMLKTNAKTAVFGVRMTRARNIIVGKTSSPQVQEEVSENPSSSQEQLETRVEEMEQEDRKQVVESQIQSEPVNIVNRGRGRGSKAQLQSKRVATSPSDLDRACEQEKLGQSDGENSIQEQMQEESTTSHAQFESTQLDRVRVEERARDINTHIQEEEEASIQPTTSQSQFKLTTESMDDEPQTQSSGEIVQSAPVNIVNRGRGQTPKTQIQSKRVAMDSSDLDEACERKKARNSNSDAPPQEDWQEGSAALNAQFDSTLAEKFWEFICAEERARESNTQIQETESDQPNTSQANLSMGIEPIKNESQKEMNLEISTESALEQVLVEETNGKFSSGAQPESQKPSTSQPRLDCVLDDNLLGITPAELSTELNEDQNATPLNDKVQEQDTTKAQSDPAGVIIQEEIQTLSEDREKEENKRMELAGKRTINELMNRVYIPGNWINNPQKTVEASGIEQHRQGSRQTLEYWNCRLSSQLEILQLEKQREAILLQIDQHDKLVELRKNRIEYEKQLDFILKNRDRVEKEQQQRGARRRRTQPEQPTTSR